MSRLSEDLASLRDRAGLSRKALSDMAGVSEGTIKLIEYGETEQPEPETLRRLANGLATNRALNRVDEGVAVDIYAMLMGSAGYALPPQAGADASAKTVRRKRSRAEARAAFERIYFNADEDGQALIDALLDHVGDTD